MKKAASKASASAPNNLGSKRQCPKCATKFYDFGKEEIVCPKCRTEIDPTALAPALKPPTEAKRASKVVDDEDASPTAGTAAGSDEFESVEDLADDDDEIVEDVAGDDGDDEESF